MLHLHFSAISILKKLHEQTDFEPEEVLLVDKLLCESARKLIISASGTWTIFWLNKSKAVSRHLHAQKLSVNVLIYLVMCKLCNKTQSLNLDIWFRQLQPNFIRNSTVDNPEAFSRWVLADTVQFARIVGGVPSVYNQQNLGLLSACGFHAVTPRQLRHFVRFTWPELPRTVRETEKGRA